MGISMLLVCKVGTLMESIHFSEYRGIVFRLWVQFAGSAPLGMSGPAFDARIGEVAHFGQQKA